jgi:hypothetical protein
MSSPNELTELQILKSLQAERSKIVDLVSSPLRFYTLALLIIETFIASIIALGMFTGLPIYITVSLIAIGIGLFIYVLMTVNKLVEKRPTNLVYTERSHLEQLAIKTFGSSAHPMSGFELNTLPPVRSPLIDSPAVDAELLKPGSEPEE